MNIREDYYNLKFPGLKGIPLNDIGILLNNGIYSKQDFIVAVNSGKIGYYNTPLNMGKDRFEFILEWAGISVKKEKDKKYFAQIQKIITQHKKHTNCSGDCWCLDIEKIIKGDHEL